MSDLERRAFTAAIGEPRDDREPAASGAMWVPCIWWYRWLVLWRDIAHANLPRLNGPCDHRRCNKRAYRDGCRMFKFTSEQWAAYKQLKDSDGLPVGIHT